jgi:propionate catabolism operon transcriptional regulator
VLAAARRFGQPAPVVSASQVSELMTHAWPGNVRELQNVIERIAVELAEMQPDVDPETGSEALITPDMLRSIAPEIVEPSHSRAKKAALTLRERSRHVEADEIRAALAAHDGDRDAVCDALGISKTTLWRKLNAAR